MNTLTSNEKLIDDFAAAVRSEYANSTPYTRRELDETRAALLAERNTIETGELLSIARDLSTMDCFWSASGHHEADCKCLSGRAERAVAAHTQKANSCVCGEPNSPGTHRTDGPCLAPIGDHHP